MSPGPRVWLQHYNYLQIHIQKSYVLMKLLYVLVVANINYLAKSFDEKTLENLPFDMCILYICTYVPTYVCMHVYYVYVYYV